MNSHPLLDENAVIAALEFAFKSRGFKIVSKCGTDETGIDLHVRDAHGTQWMIEAKGETSSKRTSKKFGKPFDANQINVHIGVAILKAMALRHSHPGVRVAIALVDEPKHRTRMESVGDALARLQIGLVWVHRNGTVTFPDSSTWSCE